jgi:ABC-2 type transport system ATP-binding protein
VSKRFREVKALDKVSFEVNAGDIFGYIGPNGAGKTTSIKILTGLIRSYGGTVSFNGTDIREPSCEIHRHIGYLPQEAGFQEWRTVGHALSTFGKLSGMKSIQLRKRIPEVLEIVGLKGLQDRAIVNLSGGMIQKLRLAQAILHRPKILILDEPLNGLDPASRYQVKKIIQDLATEERIVFFSSHILSDVENIAGRIGILNQGQIQKIGTPSELRDEFGLQNLVELEFKEGSVPERVDWNLQLAEAVEQKKGKTEIKVKTDADLDDAMREIFRRVADLSLPVRSVRHKRPSLEEVYLTLTGGRR